MHLPYRTPSRRPRRMIYIVSFLSSVYLALPIYISSTFLSASIPEKGIGLFFTATGLVGVILLGLAPRLLRRLGNYKSVLLFTAIEVVGLVTLVLSFTPLVVVSAYFVYVTATSMLPLELDIFLESESRDATTGDIRGTFLTSGNLGVLVTPLMVSFLLFFRNDFRLVFLATAALTIPLLFLIHRGFKNFKDPSYDREPLLGALQTIRGNKNLMGIYSTNFLLYFFYSWMVIYTPLYLNQHLGFSWSVIGVIFTIMLMPFVLFEVPLGRLADKRWGEKEILLTGVAIAALATGALSFIGSAVSLWAFALCMTRVGASFIEIANESYFFKQVNSTDAHLISIFRMTRLVGYVLGPLLASAVLALWDIHFLFLALGILMLSGLPAALMLTDTR